MSNQNLPNLQPKINKEGCHIVGRGSVGTPKAIILYLIDSMVDIESIATSKERIHHTEQNQTVLNGAHYYIDCEGVLCEYVDPSNTVKGISLYGSSWPLLAEYNYSNVNELFIHIAIDAPLTFASRNKLEGLIYTLSQQFEIPITREFILAPCDLNINLTSPNDIPAELLQNISARFFDCGFNPFPSIVDLGFDVEKIKEELQFLHGQNVALKLCLSEAEKAIAEQQEATQDLDVSALNEKLMSLMSTFGFMQQDILGLRKLYNAVEKCVTTLCGPVDVPCIEYTSTNPIPLVPDTQNWINLPNLITDDVPPKVLTGPMWAACLDPDVPVTVEVSATINAAEYCEGKQIKLYLVDNCGNMVLLHEHETIAGTEEVTLTGMAEVTPTTDCDSFHIEVWTNDDTEVKTISNSSVKIC